MHVKSTEERIDLMERTIKIYRLMVVVLVGIILIIERARVVGWIDSMEGWFRGLS